MAEVCLPSFLQLLITSDYLLILHTFHRAPLIVTRYFLALGGYSPTKSGTGGAKVQPVHTQKLRCLLGIGRGTNEVWAACQPVRDHYVGAGRSVMFIAEETALLDPPAISADGGQLFL